MKALRILKITAFLTAFIVLAVSCSAVPVAEETGEKSVGYVRFAVEMPKELDITDSGRIARFEYTAKPQFETTAFAVSGETEDWTEVDGDEESSALIGPFTQGRWKFEVRAVSYNGYVTWYGTGEGYINVATESVIPVTLTRVAGEGYIDFRISVPEYTTSLPAPTITVDGVKKTLVWEETGRGSGTVEFHAVADKISVGWHYVTVRVGDGGTTTGEAVAVEVSAGNYTFIRGTCSIGQYAQAYLKIEAPGAARSEIRNSSGKKILSDEMKYKESRTYTYTLTSGKTTATVTWYVNGEEAGTGKTFTFKPTNSGIYELSALSRYYAASTITDSVWIEESTSASITVYVEPKLSTITWNTGEIVTRQSVSYDTVLTLGAPIRDGYIFQYWRVTGAVSGTYKEGATLTVNGTSYTFTAVWTAAPKFKLTANTSTGILTEASGSTRTVPEEGLEVTCSKAGDYRWFVDGKEVFWILDKGDGLFKIPGKTEAGIEKGTYTVTVEGSILVSGVKKKVTGTFNITWE